MFGGTGPQVAVMTGLETPRLILRQPKGADLPAYRAYCQSARTRFTGGPYTAAQAFDKWAAMIGHWEIRGFGRLIAAERQSGRAIGHVGALQLEDDQVLEMSWTLWSDAFEGKGLAHEAARAYLDDVQRQRLFPLLLAHIEPENHRSRQLALRSGAVNDPSAPAPGWMPNGLTYRFEF